MRRTSIRIVLTLMCLGLMACGSSVSLDGGSFVRVLHAVPGLKLLDVFYDGARVSSGLAFGSTSLYRDAADGTRELKVRTAGNVQELFSTSISLRFGAHHSVLLLPRTNGIQAMTLEDLEEDPPKGKASLRIVNGISDVALVDIYVTAPGATLEDRTPAFKKIAYLGVVPYVTFDQGFTRIRFTPTGTKQVILDSGSLSFDRERNITAIAIESADGGSPYQMVLNSDNP